MLLKKKYYNLLNINIQKYSIRKNDDVIQIGLFKDSFLRFGAQMDNVYLEILNIIITVILLT